MFRLEMLARIGTRSPAILGFSSSYAVVNSVAGDVLGRIKNIFKNTSKTCNAICQWFYKKSKSGALASREEVENLRHELSQSLAEGSHYQNA